MGDSLTNREGQTLTLTKFYLKGVDARVRRTYRGARTVIGLPRDEAFWFTVGAASALNVDGVVLTAKRL